MNIVKQIDGVLEQEEDFDTDQEVFDMMMEFVTSLEPEQLSDEQNEQLMDVFDYLDPEDGGLDELRYLKRTTRKSRKQAKLYRRRHRGQLRQYRRRMKHKIRRTRITGRGISGKRLGRTRQRPRART